MICQRTIVVYARCQATVGHLHSLACLYTEEDGASTLSSGTTTSDGGGDGPFNGLLASRINRELRVRFHIIRNGRIENVGKYQSCMFFKLRIIWKQTVLLYDQQRDEILWQCVDH